MAAEWLARDGIKWCASRLARVIRLFTTPGLPPQANFSSFPSVEIPVLRESCGQNELTQRRKDAKEVQESFALLEQFTIAWHRNPTREF
jgi:hypothetical protein